MPVWVILLPCNRQETPLLVELWNTFKQHLVSSFYSASHYLKIQNGLHSKHFFEVKFTVV